MFLQHYPRLEINSKPAVDFEIHQDLLKMKGVLIPTGKNY